MFKSKTVFAVQTVTAAAIAYYFFSYVYQNLATKVDGITAIIPVIGG